MAAIDLEGSGENEIMSRQDIEAAMAKAVELRALHATLMQQGKCSSASPLSRHASYFSAQDYPVFTPSYEDDALAVFAFGQTQQENHPQNWKEYNLDATNNDEAISSEYRTANASSRKGYIHKAAEDDNSFIGSCSNNNHYSKSRRSSLGDIESVSSCNKWRKPPVAASNDNSRKSNIVVPLTDSHSSLHPNTRNKGLSSLSWLFPRLKKKSKSDNSPQHHEQVSRMLDELGMVSMETLKRELTEAQESRDAALVEAAEMKKSLGDLNHKLEYLESYCKEMKKALKQALHVKSTSSSSLSSEKLVSLSKRENSGNAESLIPVSGEVMVEGFLQIVSEARLSVKQFCKTLVAQIEETDHSLLHNLNSLLQPFNLSLNSKYSKAVVYHLEAIINQSLYQDFENCVFQKNGTPKLLDRQQECQARFQLFVALRNLSWNEVLRKGTKYYSDEFSKFCDQKMSGIIVALGWTRPWPEQLLQAFFVAAKCIWLVHLLAFSFNPALSILRVEENKAFEAHYMEDIFASKQRERGQGPSKVKLMVMPGFYMHHHQVLRCKVLCTYKPHLSN